MTISIGNSGMALSVQKAFLTRTTSHFSHGRNAWTRTVPDVQSEVEALGSQVCTEPTPKQRSQWGIARSLLNYTVIGAYALASCGKAIIGATYVLRPLFYSAVAHAAAAMRRRLLAGNGRRRAASIYPTNNHVARIVRYMAKTLKE